MQAQRTLTAAIIGNPNTGKSTLFNAISGLQSRVGNYPGVTVEKKLGKVQWQDVPVTLVDLPGTYSLSPRTLDEMVAVDVLLGRQKDVGPLDVVICIVDASNLERNLYLFSQIVDMGLPVVLVLNMMDVARSRGVSIDVEKLEKNLGVPVVSTEAHRRRGLQHLPAAALRAIEQPTPPKCDIFPKSFVEEVDELASKVTHNGHPPPRYLLERMLLDAGGQVEREFCDQNEFDLLSYLVQTRERLGTQGVRIPAVEAKSRYAWGAEF